MKKYYPLNQHIRATKVRVIDADNKQIGVLDTAKALEIARSQGLDLVVVAEKADPPVAKIIDFKKFKYQENKKTRSGSAKAKGANTKEVRITPFMADNDFNVRLDRARQFLTDGHRVKLVVKFVGRQITRKEFGVKQMERAIAALADLSSVDQDPKWQGKLYYAQLKPTNQPKTDESQKTKN